MIEPSEDVLLVPSNETIINSNEPVYLWMFFVVVVVVAPLPKLASLEFRISSIATTCSVLFVYYITYQHFWNHGCGTY